MLIVRNPSDVQIAMLIEKSDMNAVMWIEVSPGFRFAWPAGTMTYEQAAKFFQVESPYDYGEIVGNQ